MLKSYTHTKIACYIGYITQAIVANFFPLLLLVLNGEFGISITRLTVLITVNFAVQLCVDGLASGFADKIGYRVCFVAAHLFAAAGLAGLAVLPMIMPPYAGFMVASFLYAIGGGLIEVLISPTIEACPSDNKKGQMSLLHSFYCWGSAAVVLLTTLFFWGFGTVNWRIIAGVWAAIPLLNAIYVVFVPIPSLEGGQKGLSFGALFKLKSFWIFAALMMLAGASELAMSQWASAFAESGLGVSKALGDLIGPCLFAVFMGIARLLFARFGKRLRLCLAVSSSLCMVCYLVAWLSPVPALSLAACALCGFSVGILWPSVLSLASSEIPRGGTAMFGMLAMAGDIGCTAGPTIVGSCAGALGDDIGAGLAFAVIFPVLFLILCAVSRLCKNKTDGNENDGGESAESSRG